MENFKKTLHIIGIEHTVYGPKLVYQFNTYDISQDPTGDISKPQLNIFKGKKYLPKSGDKIYFFPGCNIPRFKLKEYCGKHKVAPVKFKIRANVVIMGPESYSDLFVLVRQPMISYDTFTKWLDYVFPIADNRTLQLKHDLKEVNQNFSYITLERDVWDILLDNSTPFGVILNVPNDDDGDPIGEYSDFIRIKDESCLETFNEITKTDSKYYSQDDILEGLNTGVVMDQDIYQTMKDSFNSPDVENHKLAMTFMANVDYNQSAVYVLLLIHEFGNKIYQLKNKDHVNFKSMLTYFGVDILHLSIDNIIDSLIKKKILNNHNLNVLLPFIQDEMTKKLGYKHISCKTITYSPEMLKALEESESIKEPEEITAGLIKDTVNELGKTVVEDPEKEVPLVSNSNLNL